jgi:hypothetical protein
MLGPRHPAGGTADQRIGGTRNNGTVSWVGWLRKKRRDVGKFVPPEERPPAPVEEVVEDALKIAYHGVRMAVKNRLIVDALRDGKPFDAHELEELARSEYRRLAQINREMADRAERQLARDESSMGGRIYPGGKPVIVEPEHRRKPEMLRAVADAYETRACEASAIAHLIDEAKVAAWDEVGSALSSRLAMPGPADDPDYLAFREERLARFVEEDLAALSRVELPKPDDRAPEAPETAG